MPVYLILRRPSPTTVSFTVSNASKHTNTPAGVLFYLQILLRALLFLCIVFCDIAKVRHSFFHEDGSLVRWTAVWSSPLGSFVCRIVDAYTSGVVALLSILLLYCVFRKGYTGIFNSSEWTTVAPKTHPFSKTQKNLFWSSADWASRHLPHLRPICLKLRRDSFPRRRSKI